MDCSLLTCSGHYSSEQKIQKSLFLGTHILAEGGARAEMSEIIVQAMVGNPEVMGPEAHEGRLQLSKVTEKVHFMKEIFKGNGEENQGAKASIPAS
jgi:hypothetical protein